MKKLILIILLSFFLCGCSLIPKINFGTTNTTPQSVDKSKRKVKCAGDIILNNDGTIQSCTKGFYEYSENYVKKERKYTIVERIKNFVNNLVGWGFWIFVALIFLCPGLLGAIVGRLIEATIGLTGKTLRSTITAIQKVRKQEKPIDDALSAEQDEDVKKYIRKLKEKEKIK